MSAVQFIPKVEAQPGDRVREVGQAAALEQMATVVAVDDDRGLLLCDGDQERFLPLSQVAVVVRIVSVRPSR